jgi:Cu/Ag efflux pump CusA
MNRVQSHMNESETIESAKKMIWPLLALNTIILVIILVAMFIFNSTETAMYFAIFYVVEAFLFVLFFLPVFCYNLIKHRRLKYSLSKGMHAFGDFYHFISPW